MEDDRQTALFVQQQRPQDQLEADVKNGLAPDNNAGAGGQNSQQLQLQRSTSNNSSNDLMMDDYDEDNVIVIDLSEERHASANMGKEKPASPREIQAAMASTLGPRPLFGDRQGVFDFDENDDVAHSDEDENGGAVVVEDLNKLVALGDIAASHSQQEGGNLDSVEASSEQFPLLEARKDLTTPPLRKTSSHQFEDDSLDDNLEAIRRGLTSSSGATELPPVVVNKSRHSMMLARSATLNNGSASGGGGAIVDDVAIEVVEAIVSPKRQPPGNSQHQPLLRKASSPSKKRTTASTARVSKLQRSKTINVPDVPENYNHHGTHEFANNGGGHGYLEYHQLQVRGEKHL